MEGIEGVIKEDKVVARHLEAKMRTKRKTKMWVPVETRGMRVPSTLMIKNLETKEEEVDDVNKVWNRSLLWYILSLQ